MSMFGAKHIQMNRYRKIDLILVLIHLINIRLPIFCVRVSYLTHGCLLFSLIALKFFWSLRNLLDLKSTKLKNMWLCVCVNAYIAFHTVKPHRMIFSNSFTTQIVPHERKIFIVCPAENFTTIHFYEQLMLKSITVVD